jgi:hypothetical protein
MLKSPLDHIIERLKVVIHNGAVGSVRLNFGCRATCPTEDAAGSIRHTRYRCGEIRLLGFKRGGATRSSNKQALTVLPFYKERRRALDKASSCASLAS